MKKLIISLISLNLSASQARMWEYDSIMIGLAKQTLLEMVKKEKNKGNIFEKFFFEASSN